jgi:pyruvate dehydrogenase E1 component alpha subunit
MHAVDDDATVLMSLFRTMVLIRRFEMRVQKLFRENRLPGFVHVSIGQEAVAAGSCAVLRRDDVIVTTHRGHGHVIAKGADLGRMFAELFARDEGLCHGVGGSMHLIDTECGVLCANAIVGAGIGLATGAAFSYQLQEIDRVAVAFFGDGAVNEGMFHEALNLASIWNLPVIYICENNGYAEMTAVTDQAKVTDVARRAESYAMNSASVDGNDVLAVRQAVADAVARARSGEGPSLVECKTFRHAGHYEGDQQRYRPNGEAEAWAARHDPLDRARRQLLADEADEDELTQAVALADARIDEAVRFAEAGTTPSIDLALLTYADELG